MKIASNQLIDDLINTTHQNIDLVDKLNQLPIDQLNKKKVPTSWSALECIEHLNYYGDYYIPEITSRINQSKKPYQTEFKSSWLGEYFSKMMMPKEKLNKMKTFKSTNPMGSDLDKSVLDKFLKQQQDMLNLLEKSREVNLSKTKTSISISKIIKLRLGDTFRVVIYHNLRHIQQAQRAVN